MENKAGLPMEPRSICLGNHEILIVHGLPERQAV